MAGSNSTYLNIQLDTDQIEKGIEKIHTGLGMLKTIGGNILNSITRDFSSNIKAIEGVKTQCANIVRGLNEFTITLSSVTNKNAIEISNEIKNICSSVEEIIKAREVDSGVNTATKLVDWFLQMIGLSTSADQSKIHRKRIRVMVKVVML